ncbi:MAG: metal ABC transporter substrate-binding protein [Elusimicrobia bacterium]|nr:metal ABC transporter substrate-binding protein [Candidatus Obscuribacterium magneticum]
MKIKYLILISLVLPVFRRVSEAALNVVTTTSDLASIVRAVGGDGAKVQSLASPVQNPHFVDAKPSLIVKLMKADLFIQTGMELEIGWAPLLIQSSGNKNIQAGAKGFLDASTAITPMEVPQNPSRAMGDVHPAGNPHYMTDPDNGRLVARLICDKLAELSPKDSELFRRNLKNFELKLDEKVALWEKEMKPYEGTKFVSFHKIYPYFSARFRLVSLGEIEPKPGIPPTAAHTAELIDRMRSEKCPLIFTQSWYEQRTPGFIAKQTGAVVLTLAVFPGANEKTQDYLSVIDYNVQEIVKALSIKK